MAYYVDTHPDFTDCFVLRNADTGEWQYVGDEDYFIEDYVIEEVDGWGSVSVKVFAGEAIGYKTQAAAELAAANHGGCVPRPVNTWEDDWEERDRFAREDHHAHVVEGWRHHWATAHIEPGHLLDLPF